MALQISVAILSTLLVGYFGYSSFNLHKYLYPKRLSSEEEQIISKNFSFYNRLDTDKKKIFQQRVLRFIADKEFVSRNGIVITREMKVLIAASAVMITFGMKRFLIESVDKIIIYPTQYYSEINEVDHLGEFNPLLKAVVFSWEDFLNGMVNKKDNKNLGIHEFAHSIYFNSLKYRDTSSVLFANGIAEIDELLNDEGFLLKLESSRYLRTYAQTNKFEFFAVCLEHFVETPDQFKKEFPELYQKVKTMLNFNYTGY